MKRSTVSIRLRKGQLCLRYPVSIFAASLNEMRSNCWASPLPRCRAWISRPTSRRTTTPSRMSQLTEGQKEQVVSLLAEMVRIPSVNKTAEQADRERAELRMSNFLEKHLAGMGMQVRRVPLVEGRDNLVAEYPDDSGPATIAFESHMDTVGVDNMTIDPFGAEIRNGRMWGRGTCDTKGSAAVYLTALDIARQRGLRFVDRVCYVAAVAEETGCHGAE